MRARRKHSGEVPTGSKARRVPGWVLWSVLAVVVILAGRRSNLDPSARLLPSTWVGMSAGGGRRAAPERPELGLQAELLFSGEGPRKVPSRYDWSDPFHPGVRKTEPAPPGSTDPDVNEALAPLDIAALDRGEAVPPLVFQFSSRASFHGRALAVGVYLDVQPKTKGAYKNATCALDTAWLSSVRQHSFPAVLLHNCLPEDVARAADGETLRVIRATPRDPVTTEPSSIERRVGLVADWLRSADVAPDRIFVSFNPAVRVDRDPFAMMADNPHDDLFWSAHPVTRAFERRYWRCFDGEALPASGVLVDLAGRVLGAGATAREAAGGAAADRGGYVEWASARGREVPSSVSGGVSPGSASPSGGASPPPAPRAGTRHLSSLADAEAGEPGPAARAGSGTLAEGAASAASVALAAGGDPASSAASAPASASEAGSPPRPQASVARRGSRSRDSAPLLPSERAVPSATRAGLDYVGGDSRTVARVLARVRTVLQTVPSPRDFDCSQAAAYWVAARTNVNADVAAADWLLASERLWKEGRGKNATLEAGSRELGVDCDPREGAAEGAGSALEGCLTSPRALAAGQARDAPLFPDLNVTSTHAFFSAGIAPSLEAARAVLLEREGASAADAARAPPSPEPTSSLSSPTSNLSPWFSSPGAKGRKEGDRMAIQSERPAVSAPLAGRAAAPGPATLPAPGPGPAPSATAPSRNTGPSAPAPAPGVPAGAPAATPRAPTGAPAAAR